MLATEAEKWAGKPQTFAEAMGYAADGPLELNSASAATCQECGQEPRMYHHLSPKGRDVTIWIPQNHRCVKRQETPT